MSEPRTLYRPALGPVRQVVFAVERLADLVCSSAANPLYRSGTVAIVAFAMVMGTGVYLLCFYDISAPYQSVALMEEKVWFGRLMRSVHRIASDVCIVFSLFHLLQVLVRGKTFGPRRVAWWSGFFLLALTLVTAWTGYVLVWDLFGQSIALFGAQLLQVVPFLRDTIAQAFDGATPLLESFYFMNLFLHVALPVGLIGGLWVHTSRLTKPNWFPRRSVAVGVVAGIAVASYLFPVPLLPEADLLSLPQRIPSDTWYAFWLHPLYVISPEAFSALILCLGLLSLAVPFWLRPEASKRRHPSQVSPERCTGCTQCAQDCPYQAIRMVPRADGRRLVAEVNPVACVSCGVCVGSCDDMAIGPPDRQVDRELARFAASASSAAARSARDGVAIGLIVCGRNREMVARLARQNLSPPFVVDCTGALHHDLIRCALESYAGLVIVSCPSHGCENRVGAGLAADRIARTRVPFLPKEIAAERVILCAASDVEGNLVAQAVTSLAHRLTGGGAVEDSRPHGTWRRRLAAVVAGAGVMAGIVFMGRHPIGTSPDHGLLRVSVRLRGLGRTVCRDLTADELRSRPRHMQAPECSTERPPYQLVLHVNGRREIGRTFTHLGVRGDAPLFVHHDLPLAAGQHNVEVLISPVGDAGVGERFGYVGEVQVARGRISLITRSGAADPTLRVLSTVERREGK